MSVTSSTLRRADATCHPGLEAANLVRLGRVRMACKARRLGEDLQAQLDHNVLRHHQPSTSSFENHTAAPYGSLLDPFSTRCRRLFLGPDGCSHRSRLTRKLTAPLCASRTHLAAFPASPGVTTFTRQIEVSPRTPFRDCVRHGTRMCDIAARRADTWGIGSVRTSKYTP